MSYHHGNLRDALLRAAVSILEEEGPSGLRLRAVARRAGVSRQAPYHHFRDVEHLIATVAEQGFTRLLASLDTAWSAAGGADGGVASAQALAVAYVGFAVADPGRFRVMFGPQLRRREAFPELARSADRVFAALSRTPEALHLTRGDPGPAAGDLDPADPRVPLWAVVHGLAQLLIDRQLTAGPPGPDDARRLTLAATQAIWFGLGPGRDEA